MEPRTITVSTLPALWDLSSPISAGVIHTYLETAGVLGIVAVMVQGDGMVSVEVSDPTQAPAIVSALDLLDPASEEAKTPEEVEDTTLTTNVQTVLDRIEAKLASDRTDAEKDARVLAKAILKLYRRVL